MAVFQLKKSISPICIFPLPDSKAFAIVSALIAAGMKASLSLEE